VSSTGPAGTATATAEVPAAPPTTAAATTTVPTTLPPVPGAPGTTGVPASPAEDGGLNSVLVLLELAVITAAVVAGALVIRRWRAPSD
jgi:hypothetical protein